jgi:hypothetical protein
VTAKRVKSLALRRGSQRRRGTCCARSGCSASIECGSVYVIDSGALLLDSQTNHCLSSASFVGACDQAVERMRSASSRSASSRACSAAFSAFFSALLFLAIAQRAKLRPQAQPRPHRCDGRSGGCGSSAARTPRSHCCTRLRARLLPMAIRKKERAPALIDCPCCCSLLLTSGSICPLLLPFASLIERSQGQSSTVGAINPELSSFYRAPETQDTPRKANTGSSSSSRSRCRSGTSSRSMRTPRWCVRPAALARRELCGHTRPRTQSESLVSLLLRAIAAAGGGCQPAPPLLPAPGLGLSHQRYTPARSCADGSLSCCPCRSRAATRCR